MENLPRIGFPRPLLGDRSWHLPVLYEGDGFFVIEKPVGVLIDAFPLYPDCPSLVKALDTQVKAHKPELDLYATGKTYGVYFLDAEISGLALIATTKDKVALFRNALGSGQFKFTFRMVTRAPHPEATEIECDLPIAIHRREPRCLISNRTGKKSKTYFVCQARTPKFALWTATTDFIRPHQIRLHAMERGLNIVGESLYTKTDPLMFSETIEGKKAGAPLDKPLHEGCLLSLEQIEFDTLSVAVNKDESIGSLHKLISLLSLNNEPAA